MDRREETTKRFSDLYRVNSRRIEENSAGIINSFREDAMKQFVELGVPGRKNEAYKYTNLDPWIKNDYNSYFVPRPEDFKAAEDFECEVVDLFNMRRFLQALL